MATRPVAYSKFISRLQSLMGLGVVTANELPLWNDYFNRNIKQVWEGYEWPELCPTAPFMPNASAVIPLDFASNGVDDIDVVFNVWTSAPNGTFPQLEQPFILGADGIEFIPVNLPSTVWVNYRTRCPDYAGGDWNGMGTYAAGDQAYFDNGSTADYYQAIIPNTGVSPTNATTWEKLIVPYVLFETVVQLCYADALAADGQMTKADDARGYAEIVSARETDKIQRQQRQQPRVNVFRTHGTQQLRNAGIGFPY